MSKEAAVLATVAAGGAVALQAPANQVLSKQVGTFGSAVVSFAVGTLCVVVVTFAFAGGLEIDEGFESPAWYYWILGGVGGAVIVTTTLITVRELGAGGTTAATISGQLVLSVMIDRLGILGLEERAVTWDKLLGIVLLTAGVILVVRE